MAIVCTIMSAATTWRISHFTYIHTYIGTRDKQHGRYTKNKFCTGRAVRACLRSTDHTDHQRRTPQPPGLESTLMAEPPYRRKYR